MYAVFGSSRDAVSHRVARVRIGFDTRPAHWAHTVLGFFVELDSWMNSVRDRLANRRRHFAQSGKIH